MNENLPPPFVAATTASTAKTSTEPPLRLSRLLLGLAVAIAAFDSCFWRVNTMGFSMSIFVLVLAGIIMANRESSKAMRISRLLLALLAGAALAAAIETGVTNTLVLVILIITLAGVTYFDGIESFWGRWLSQIVALIFAPGRIFWLAARLIEVAFGRGLGWTGGLIGGCLLVVPTLVLALIFGSLLATGNAVFGDWTKSFFDWFWKELWLYLDIYRFGMWMLVAFLVLPFLRPATLSSKWWRSTDLLARLPEIIPTRGAVFSSGLVLVVLNLLFLVANLADALFLWTGQALPKGVTYSGFVHSGTNALTWTVLLSAIVLTVIFQQALQVVQRRELKGLALFWIAQNLFLLLSVALRLKLYIEAYDMTVLRLSVIIFLVVVAAGYALLTIKIIQERSLAWLIGGCVLAIFATFYITQFLNLGGWSANYNVARWEKDRTRTLDTGYLYSLGAEACPALDRLHEINPVIPVVNDEENRGALNTASVDEDKFDTVHWREFSLRAWMNRGALEDKPHN